MLPIKREHLASKNWVYFYNVFAYYVVSKFEVKTIFWFTKEAYFQNLGVAKSPPWATGVVRPPQGPKKEIYIYMNINFGIWGWFGHPQGPKPSNFYFILFLKFLIFLFFEVLIIFILCHVSTLIGWHVTVR